MPCRKDRHNVCLAYPSLNNMCSFYFFFKLYIFFMNFEETFLSLNNSNSSFPQSGAPRCHISLKSSAVSTRLRLHTLRWLAFHSSVLLKFPICIAIVIFVHGNITPGRMKLVNATDTGCFGGEGSTKAASCSLSECF